MTRTLGVLRRASAGLLTERSRDQWEQDQRLTGNYSIFQLIIASLKGVSIFFTNQIKCITYCNTYTVGYFVVLDLLTVSVCLTLFFIIFPVVGKAIRKSIGL